MNAVQLYIFLKDATEPSKINSLSPEKCEEYRKQWSELRQSSMLDRAQEALCDERMQLLLAEVEFGRSEARETGRHRQILCWTKVGAVAAIVAAIAALLALCHAHG